MLSLTQRLERLNQRLAEWHLWLERDTIPLNDWRCNDHPVRVGDLWGTPEQPFADENDALWYFTHPPVRIPDAWHSAETRLVLDMGGESLLFIDYLEDSLADSQTEDNSNGSHHDENNGSNNRDNSANHQDAPTRRTVTLGHDPNHQRYVLTGRHFALRTESVARLPFGVPARAPRLKAARLVRWEVGLEHFLRLLTLLSESAQELLSHEVTPYLLDAAESALAQVSVPSHSPAFLQRHYHTDSMQSIWRRPIPEHQPPENQLPAGQLVELDNGTRAAIDSAHTWLKTRLQHLQQHYPPQGQLALSGHAHIDVAWLWPLAETWRKARRTFATALDVLERYPEATFNQSSAQLYTAVQDRDPALFARIVQTLQQPHQPPQQPLPPLTPLTPHTSASEDAGVLSDKSVTNRTANNVTNNTTNSVSVTTGNVVANKMNDKVRGGVATDTPVADTSADAVTNASRWEAVGGMWIEPDTNMPTGESLVRQLLYGQRYFHAHSGRYQQVAWLPDCFGFAPALPQLLRLAGIDSFFTIKVNWSETNRFPVDLFWWEGLDGSRVLAHTFDNPVGGYNGELGPQATLATWRNYRGKTQHPESLLTIGFGDGGGGLTDEMLERYRAMQDLPVLPKLRFSTVHDYFARAHAHVAEHAKYDPDSIILATHHTNNAVNRATQRDKHQHHHQHRHQDINQVSQQIPVAADISSSRRPLPVWSGEMYLELHRGTTTTQGRTKRLHRQAEQALIAAEALSSMVTLATGKSVNTLVTPADSPDPKLAGGSLERCWQVLLTQQFHDILPGSSIAEVYAQSERDLASIIATSRARIDEQRALLADHLVKSGQQDGMFVVNPQASDRPLRIRLDEPYGDAQATQDGFLLTRPKSIMGFSGNVVLAGNNGTPLPVQVSERKLENAFVRVELAADGSIERIFDRHAGREVLTGRGNRLRAYVDKPRQWGAWDIDEGYLYEGQDVSQDVGQDVGQDITDVSDWRISERGPHRIAVAITRTFQHSTIHQELRLWANSARLDIHTRLDWHDRHWLLKAHFPVNIRTQQATFETAFGVLQRPTHRNTSWQQAQFEVPGHRFVDVSETNYGVALLNDGRYGHHARNLRHGVDVGLSLLRAPTFPDPLADEGEHEFTYSVYPHTGHWLAGGVLREAEDLNLPLSAQRVRTNFETSLQLIELRGLPLGLGALKTLEDDPGLLLRCFEPQGARGQVRLGLPGTWRAVQELDLLERPLGKPNLHFDPFQVRSWKLEEG